LMETLLVVRTVHMSVSLMVEKREVHWVERWGRNLAGSLAVKSVKLKVVK
jgi:hypothetical protein